MVESNSAAPDDTRAFHTPGCQPEPRIRHRLGSPSPSCQILSNRKTAPGLKVLVVDDHPAFRYGIVRLLKHIAGEVCGEAGDSPQALEAFRTCQPDIVLMDIFLPGMDGMELMKMMLSEKPKLTVPVISMHDEPTYALRASSMLRRRLLGGIPGSS